MSRNQIYAKVIADSVYEDGRRLTTLEVCFHRFVLAEFNTHRILSKNSASSRAIPVWKQIAKVRENPAIPIVFPAEQKGMQGGQTLSEDAHLAAEATWRTAAKKAAGIAEDLVAQGVHKSVTNRVLEPFLMHTAVITGTSFENFFAQRVSPLAQPEIREVATAMKFVMDHSEPQILEKGQWHLPYIDAETADQHQDDVDVLTKRSAARCARVSYLTHDGQKSLEADTALWDTLTTSEPPHWSPLEHVATPAPLNLQKGVLFVPRMDGERFSVVRRDHLAAVGNLPGWASLRTIVEAEKGLTTAA